MKITRLEIKEYKQFKDLTLDLTYPLGHEKAGEPLDKICIIGQSGTGKTNLLEMIRDKVYTNDVKTEIVKDEESDSEEVYFKGTNNITINDKNNNPNDKEFINYMQITKNRIKKNLLDLSPMIILLIIAFIFLNIQSSNLLIPIFKYIPLLFIGFILFLVFLSYMNGIWNNLLQNKSEIIKKYINRTSYIQLDESSWYLLKDKISNYSKEEKEFNSKLFNKIMLDKSYASQAEKDKKEWENQNQNILNAISDKLNTILINFNLELTKIDKNQKSYNDLIFKDLSNKKIIKYDELSTGTKNIISTFIPLKIHNPKDSIILIDEPENSFYPDIQRKLTELYMEVGENNQLIMATHSPLISSSFEPWEVVELKFDEDTHQIYREDYFDSENDERHIDNYTLDPRMLTWTGILTQIFDLKEDSNFEIREKALMQYIRLERDIEKIEDKKEKMQKFEELMKLSERLGLSDNEKN